MEKWLSLAKFAPAFGAPDCPVRTEQCPVPRLARPTNRPLSEKLSAPRLKFIELSDVTLDCPMSPRPMVTFSNGRLPLGQKGQKVRMARESQSHQTVRCAIGTDESNDQLQRTTDVTGHNSLVRTGQTAELL